MAGRRGSGLVANSWWHRWTIRRRGRKDGRMGIPPADASEPALYERELMALARQIMEDTRERYLKRIQVLEARYNTAVESLDGQVAEFTAELERYNEKKRILGRGVTIHISRMWYRFFLILIGVAELAFNFQAFQVFEKPLPLTFLMSLAVAVGLPLSGHFIGVWLKQWPPPVWKTALFVVTWVAIGAVCILGVNIARSEYLRLLDVDLAAHEQVLQNAFLMINLFVFGTAILISYFAHDADPEFEKLHNDVRRLDSRCRRTSDKILRLAGRIDALKTQLQAEVNLTHAIFEELVYIYRGQNQRKRKDSTFPKVFADPPNLPGLEQLAEVQPMVDLQRVNAILARYADARKVRRSPQAVEATPS